MNGRSIETEEKSELIKGLARKIMNGDSLLSLALLRLSLDKNAIDVEQIIDIKEDENPIVDQILDILEDNSNPYVTYNDVENAVRSVVEQHELSSQ